MSVLPVGSRRSCQLKWGGGGRRDTHVTHVILWRFLRGATLKVRRGAEEDAVLSSDMKM